MNSDARYCPNCRAELPRKAEQCPQCGTFAGDVFDGRLPRRSRSRRWLYLIILVAALAGAFTLRPWKEPAPPRQETPVRVVSDRPGGARRAPGAALSEPEAMRALRRHLTTESQPADCLVISSQGWRDRVYNLTALNRCTSTPLGRWRVDGATGEVKP